MKGLVDRLEEIIASPQLVLDLKDDRLRQRLRDAGRKLSLSLEARNDSIHRIAFSVRICRSQA